MIRLHVPTPLSADAAVLPTLDQSRYLTQVMRLKTGDSLTMIQQSITSINQTIGVIAGSSREQSGRLREIWTQSAGKGTDSASALTSSPVVGGGCSDAWSKVTISRTASTIWPATATTIARASWRRPLRACRASASTSSSMPR